MASRYWTIILIFTTIFSLATAAWSQTGKTQNMPKEELDNLMNAVLPFAQKMLSEHGEFYPYGGAMTSTGEIISIAPSDGAEQPPSQKLIDIMTEGFRSKAKSGDYRATAIVVDVRITVPSTGKKIDAIQMRLDHAKGMSVEVVLPYEIDSKGKVVYGEMFTQKGSSQIFGSSKEGH